MPRPPVAYFITIRSYGTWLAGDERGSVDDDHNARGEPFKRRDDFRRKYQERQLKTLPLKITPAMRTVIEAEIERTCTFRDWDLHAINVRTEHVHLVVTAPIEPEAVMRELKVYATRALRREGLVAKTNPVWASHGSTVHAFTDADVAAYVAYTLDEQGDDLPGSSWRLRNTPAQD